VFTAAIDQLKLFYTGGRNSPYIWMKCPDGKGSWAFFDELLERADIICTPGSGFGQSGEGYVRFSMFGTPEDTEEAARRMTALYGKQ